MSVTELFIRLAIAFITLLVLTRIMGRKEISQMTFFNFVSAISIGTIGASLAIDPDFRITYGLIALVSWSAFTIFLGFLDIKSKKVRFAIVGRPIILIRKGRIMENALRKARLDTGSLKALLRKKNVFSMSDIDYAIFETDGSLSVIKKEAKQLVTKEDMNLQVSSDIYPFPLAVISDGKINKDNLKSLNLDKKWLKEQMQSAGFNSFDNIFYAEVQKDGSLYIDSTNDMIH
ncbi:DUF421 domain-containing protein [Cytobacillus sp. NCCP-133]|uniref:DUF421 domain-containing protein n=1 Tax=Cytobacillus sp. NCCP-133 TaxID=766848 RepID=UPI00222E2758|nr:DUF421 domain-containing protein [Cytobacillus sp. NCCP-133]GLB61418.1 DUF421 domain-containing protein [Cytobacillus sp. NCCP-133]